MPTLQHEDRPHAEALAGQQEQGAVWAVSATSPAPRSPRHDALDYARPPQDLTGLFIPQWYSDLNPGMLQCSAEGFALMGHEMERFFAADGFAALSVPFTNIRCLNLK